MEVKGRGRGNKYNALVVPALLKLEISVLGKVEP